MKSGLAGVLPSAESRALCFPTSVFPSGILKRQSTTLGQGEGLASLLLMEPCFLASLGEKKCSLPDALGTQSSVKKAAGFSESQRPEVTMTPMAVRQPINF